MLDVTIAAAAAAVTLLILWPECVTVALHCPGKLLNILFLAPKKVTMPTDLDGAERARAIHSPYLHSFICLPRSIKSR